MSADNNDEGRFVLYLVVLVVSCAVLMCVGIVTLVLAFTVYNPWFVLIGSISLALGAMGSWYFYDELTYTENNDV